MNDTRAELIQALENSIRLLRQEIALGTQRWTPGAGSGDMILIVTMPDGRPIRRRSQAQTFGCVIENLGVEDVKDLELTVGTLDLITQNPDPNPHYNYYPVGQYHIFTTLNVWDKKAFLETIADQLDKPLQVEIFCRVADQDD